MDKLMIIVGSVVAVVALVLALSCLLAWPVQLLWNWVGVDVLGLKQITFKQAWGILMLAGLIFKNGSSRSSSK